MIWELTMAQQTQGNDDAEAEPWEQEFLASHRWGRHGGRAEEEHARLKRLREAVPLMDGASTAAMEQIVALEICNWNLEENILALCAAIGGSKPIGRGTGHMASISSERWRKVWAYYLTLRKWLPREGTDGYQTALETCDPHGKVRDHVIAMLGEPDELKELYVERMCLCLEFWLAGFPARESSQGQAHNAAVLAVEEEIRKRDPQGKTLSAFQLDGDGKLQPCHHKAFRRYDIIISSIGAAKWRAAMPPRGDGPAERVGVLDKYLSRIESWANGKGDPDDEIDRLLGKPDATKVFLASLLASLLRGQQLSAKHLAAERATASS